MVLETNFGKTGMTWNNADFNGDGTTDFADYIILEAHFGEHLVVGGGDEEMLQAGAGGPTSLPELTDLNGDGKIDDADMLILFEQIRNGGSEEE
jgi:hypothetical protein